MENKDFSNQQSQSANQKRNQKLKQGDNNQSISSLLTQIQQPVGMSFNLDRFKIQPVAFFKSQREEADYFLAFHKEKKQDRYLLKIYTVKNLAQEERVNNEVNMNLKAQGVNQNVIKVKGVTKSQSVDPITQIKDKKIIILMQYVSQNLRDVIKFKKVAEQNQYFTPNELKMQMKGLIKTLADLQHDNISHRRIELESIYFVNQNTPFLLGDFYHSKNLIGQQDSEIRQIDQSEIKQMRFPDKKSLECLLNNEFELKANYYKMDVYTLGIVFCQLATLEIYEGFVDFDRQYEYAIQQIEQRYGRNIQEFISLMLAPREERLDFIGLEEIMDEILDQESGQEQNIRCSIFPDDRNNLTVISEDNLRDDFSSSSSNNDLFQRDESSDNYSLSQNSSLPQRFMASNKDSQNRIGLTNPHSNFSQLQSRDEQQITQSLQVFDIGQKQEIEKTLQRDHNLTNTNNNYQTINQLIQPQQQFPQTTRNQIIQLPFKPQIDQNRNQRYQMNSSQSERGFKGYDQHLQIPIEKSIPYQYSPQHLHDNQSNNYTEINVPKDQSLHPYDIHNLVDENTVPRNQGNNIYDEFSANYILRSTQLQSQNLEQMKYEELVKKAKTLQNLQWFEKKNIKIMSPIGRGRLSEVRQCETKERNCCIVKIYFKKKNTEVWDMIQSLNKFNKINCNMVIKIEGYYINNIQSSNNNNNQESELWLIQKQKKYNLITVQQRFNISLQQRITIARKLTQTIIDLHISNISHGDIKPQNILLDLQLNPFLTDFVVCDSMIGPSQLIKSRGFETGYSAPEQFNDMQFCQNSDIWSLGIIFQEFIIGHKVDAATVHRFGLYDPQKQGSLDLVQEGSSETYRIISNLIKQMTQYNPDRRLPLKQVVEQLDYLDSLIKKRNKEYLQKNRQSIQHIPIYQQDCQPNPLQGNKQYQACVLQAKQQTTKKTAAVRYQMYKK